MDDLSAIVARFRDGTLSAEKALMELVIASEDVSRVERVIAGESDLATLLGQNKTGVERIVSMLRAGVDSDEPAPDIESGIAFARRLFDWSVQQHEETSVALYSLGNPAILAAATTEVVAALDRQGILHNDSRVAELGCGIGRFLVALSTRVAHLHGLDVSPNMVEVARRRTAALTQVDVYVASGRDLQPIPTHDVDLVLAVDVFPYVVQAGAPLVEAVFADICRVLRPRGHLALFEYSYRGNPTEDASDVASLAEKHELVVHLLGEPCPGLWQGRFFHLQKRA